MSNLDPTLLLKSVFRYSNLLTGCLDYLHTESCEWHILSFLIPALFILKLSLLLDSKEFAWSAGDPSFIPGSEGSPGEGNGNPLRYSCLESSMDRGAWWATVHGVAKSQTRWVTNTLLSNRLGPLIQYQTEGMIMDFHVWFLTLMGWFLN